MASYMFLFLSVIFTVLNSCFAVEPSDAIVHHLGTKSPYRFVANTDLDVGKYPGCKSEKIWMLIRHGTRYPSDDLILFMQRKLPSIRNQILENYEKSLNRLTEEQIESFKNWKPVNVSQREEKKLTTEGSNEMIQLAKRMQSRFSDIIPKIYNNLSLEFKHTPTERTYESAKQFVTGLFGETNIENVSLVATKRDDPVLRFYKNCKNWKRFVKKNPNTYKQLNLYINSSSEMSQALKNISHILGYNETVPFMLAKLFYQTCAFETAWNDSYNSPWCYPFTNSTIQAMEYTEDLKYYWVDGYGSPLTQKLACTVVNEVLNIFRDTSRTSGGVFQFSHSGTLLKVLTHLGLFESSAPLMHDSRDVDRLWRVSKIDTFGSNLGAVLYRCTNDELKVLLLHQEKPLRLPECPDDDLCPLETIIRIRTPKIENCNLSEMCHSPTYKDEL